MIGDFVAFVVEVVETNDDDDCDDDGKEEIVVITCVCFGVGWGL